MDTPVASLMRVWAQMSLRARSILLCTITSGIFLRVFCLETFEFNRDQLDKILDGLAVPGQHWWIECAGTTSVGIPISPCFTYIMAVFTSITSDPYAVTAIFVVLNCIVLILAVFFFAVFARNHLHFLLCVVLFSLSPYLIVYSRRIWEPDLLLLFVIPLVLMAVRVRDKPWLLLPVGLVSSVVFQLHQSGVFFVPLFTILALAPLGHSGRNVTGEPIGHRKKVALWGAAGLIAFLLPLVPYLNFIFHNFHSFSHPALAHQAGFYERVRGIVRTLTWLVRIATGSDFWNYHLSGNESAWNWPFAPLPGGILICSYLLIVPLMMGLYYYARVLGGLLGGGISSDQAAATDRKDIMCIGSIAGLALVYCAVGFMVYPHHLTIIMPFLILPLSLGTLSLFELRSRWKNLFRVVTIIGLTSYVLQFPFLLSYVKANNGSAGRYGISYEEKWSAAQKITMLPGTGTLTFNPLLVDLNGISEPSDALEIPYTIAYICGAVFGREVVFQGSPGTSTRILRLHNNGRKLELTVEPQR